LGDHYVRDGHLKEMANESGTGLVIQANKHEFYLVGFNFRFMLRPKPTLENMQFTLHGHDMDHPSYINFVLRVDEGRFNKKGEFVSERVSMAMIYAAVSGAQPTTISSGYLLATNHIVFYVKRPGYPGLFF